MFLKSLIFDQRNIVAWCVFNYLELSLIMFLRNFVWTKIWKYKARNHLNCSYNLTKHVKTPVAARHPRGFKYFEFANYPSKIHVNYPSFIILNPIHPNSMIITNCIRKCSIKICCLFFFFLLFSIAFTIYYRAEGRWWIDESQICVYISFGHAKFAWKKFRRKGSKTRHLLFVCVCVRFVMSVEQTYTFWP